MKRETKYTETERNEMKRSEIYRNETERNETKWNVHKNWKGMQFSETNIPKRNKTEYVDKGNNKITELRTILQRESQNS